MNQTTNLQFYLFIYLFLQYNAYIPYISNSYSKHLTYKWVTYLTLQYLQHSYSTTFIDYLLGYTFTTHIPVLPPPPLLYMYIILFKQD